MIVLCTKYSRGRSLISRNACWNRPRMKQKLKYLQNTNVEFQQRERLGMWILQGDGGCRVVPAVLAHRSRNLQPHSETCRYTTTSGKYDIDEALVDFKNLKPEAD